MARPQVPSFVRHPAFALGGILAVLAGTIALSLLQEPAYGQQPSHGIEGATTPFPLPPEMQGLQLMHQTTEQAHAKSAGCLSCHVAHDPHFGTDRQPSFHLGCVDCHGGDATCTTKEKAHVAPRWPDAWRTSGNPVRSYTLLNHEAPEFVRFVNPGDLRIAHISCGTAGCHPKEVLQNHMSMMAHGCMLWGAALYNNGSVPHKWSKFAEAYTMNGTPMRLQTWPPPTDYERNKKGVLPFLDPLPRFEISQPGNILRIFERGGRFRPETGIPEREEEPGRPRARLSNRGLGTENRTDPVFIGLQRTRLLDPTTNFLGTNDHPGDFRSSGCTSCHVIYANDRSRINSGPYAKFGNLGRSSQADPCIPRDEPGHPIEHRFTTAIPSSQCIVCHMHPGTTVLQTYLGYMWWDEETDGEVMYPKEQKYPTAEEYTRAAMNNPDETSMRGLWSDPRFLEKVYDLNPQLKHTQFADFHGHGWVFKAVFKKDRHGHLLDHEGRVIPEVTNSHLRAAMMNPEYSAYQHRGREDGTPDKSRDVQRDGIPVHLLDIHTEKGMHCIDCHFTQDNHGNTKLYGEVRAAIEIQCIDCHGTVTQRPNLKTTGPAAPEPGGRNLATMKTPFGKPRFEWRGDKLIQNSMVEKDLSWEIHQTIDVINPNHPYYNEKGALAKTVRHGAVEGTFDWGNVPGGDESKLAHPNNDMHCIACHSSWNPSCFGCHLTQKAAKKMPALHWEGDVQRNYTSYNFQTLRDDVYMLARDGDVTCNRIGPARSSCAVHVSSFDINRSDIYIQQQTISADGPSGIAFSTNVPHTVRGGPPGDGHGHPLHPENANKPGTQETKSCTDCHLSKDGDNNALIAQLFMQGTGYVNWIGRYCWVAGGEHGLEAVVVTEQDEPQTVIGSTLHALAYPDFYKKHVDNGRKLEHAEEHPGYDISEKIAHPFRKHEVLQVQHRGEYLYAACGCDGVRVFDIAFIDHKQFAERITTAPVSPWGQRFYVKTQYCTAIASPATTAPDPTRKQSPENKEPKIAGIYAYLYAADKYEGLILIGAGTLLDGDPTNNFLKRDVTFNPGGILNGACGITIIGNYAYMCADAGLVVVSLEDPKEPKVTAVIGEPELKKPHFVQAQFRYAYVCDEEGVRVLDITDLAKPKAVGHHLELHEAHTIYLARTYAYVAAGHQGLVILDIEHPEHPKIDQVFNAGGCINDCHDVKLGITYTSEFAYLADGKNGLRVVQLTSPDTPGNTGFSPRPTPCLIATYKLEHGGHALNIARGVDRDRAIDESGNQLSVFGRVGARPLSLAEQQKMYLRNGRPWYVTDNPADPMFRKVP